MFRILLFLVASPHVAAIAWIGTVYLCSGDLANGLPFLAICLMCASYLLKGISGVFARLQNAVNWEKISD